ncbi:hypothetical protein CROQUDRAFT_682417 [Cronartium quercuum f. sp. fusiforme G11]|uniref:Uncharacterized protein n=1 Tax=Cronartium quercuum f. sp. fusiforme G11 TaxID=708437 RepID=A0A9P6T7T1_9BASI|nr:hypothetical protein CROQUDRAFT_682417 [Cronartium quercuum f. sp. fusiforme G11]
MAGRVLGFKITSIVHINVWEVIKEVIVGSVEDASHSTPLQQVADTSFTQEKVELPLHLVCSADLANETTSQSEFARVKCPLASVTLAKGKNFLPSFSCSSAPITHLAPQPVVSDCNSTNPALQLFGPSSPSSCIGRPPCRTSTRVSRHPARPRSNASKDVHRRLMRSSLRTWRNKQMSDERWNVVLDDMRDELEKFMLEPELPQALSSPPLFSPATVTDISLAAPLVSRRSSTRLSRPRSTISKAVHQRLLRSSWKTWCNKAMSEDQWDLVMEDMELELELFMLQPESLEDSSHHSRSSSCGSDQSLSSATANSDPIPTLPLSHVFNHNPFDTLEQHPDQLVSTFVDSATVSKISSQISLPQLSSHSMSFRN